jgi:anaphase-promoting complex subunit 4
MESGWYAIFSIPMSSNQNQNPGQSVAVLYEPLNISIHSIQDGKKLYGLPVGSKHSQSSRKQVVGISVRWFKDEQPIQRTSIPDIFKRNGLIVRRLLDAPRLF